MSTTLAAPRQASTMGTFDPSTRSIRTARYDHEGINVTGQVAVMDILRDSLGGVKAQDHA
jgi:hypothetical protein